MVQFLKPSCSVARRPQRPMFSANLTYSLRHIMLSVLERLTTPVSSDTPEQ